MTFSSIKFGLYGMAIMAISACSSEPHNDDGDKSTGQEVSTTDELSVDRVAEANGDDLASGEQNADEGIIRSADAHSHGQANLAIVLEGESVFIELESPLYNVLGFEYAPENDQQEQIVLNARSALTKAEGLFTINSAGNCTLSEVSPLPDFFDSAHGGHHHDEEHGEHKDLIVSYEYNCEKPGAISEVTINLFDSFESMRELDVTILGPNMQKQVTLSPNNTKITF